MNTILRMLTILLFGSIIFAEGGKISGIVIEKDSGEPLPGYPAPHNAARWSRTGRQAGAAHG